MDLSKIVKKTQTKCPCCGSKTEIALSLPEYPLTELFRDGSNLEKARGFVDQSGRYCESCNHFFLETVLNNEIIYSKENYVTSSDSSKGAVNCIDELVSFIRKTKGDFSLGECSMIDIGGNDSTLLKRFANDTSNLVNIDPHATTDNPSIILRNEFLETIDFGDYKQKKPNIFISSHTFEHLENPVEILKNLCACVSDKDLIYLQFPSIEKLVQYSRFDQICHQHINLFSFQSIVSVMEKQGLYLNAYEYDTLHFGTIRLKFSRKGEKKDLRQDVCTLKDIEKSYSAYVNFYQHFSNLLEGIFSNGQGFGAGLMVPTLCYHLPIINNLSKIIDESKSRVGKKFLNLDPPIVGTEHFEFNKPILITSISTKAAARTIFGKLDELGFKDIYLPTICA